MILGEWESLLGGESRNGPTGGSAYGMPLNISTLSPNLPATVTPDLNSTVGPSPCCALALAFEVEAKVGVAKRMNSSCKEQVNADRRAHVFMSTGSDQRVN